MRGLSTELKVGFFAVVVITILAFMTFKVGGLEWMKKDGNVFYVYFKNIAGLDAKTKVKIAGVDTGVIEKIELLDGRAKITIKLDKSVQIYTDAVASIKASGLLGDKYLDIKTGSERPVLGKGATINNVLEVVDVDDMLRKLSKVSDTIGTLASTFNEALGTEEAKKSLKESILNLGQISANLNETILANDKKMRMALDNMTQLTTSLNDLVDKNRGAITATIGNLENFSAHLKKDGPDLVANLNKATKDLKDMVEENRPAVKNAVESINNITARIEKGEGTLGKLVKDDRLYESVNKAAEGVDRTISAVERFRTFVTFQADYLTKPKDSKGYFYVTLQPQPDKYYILGAVGDPIGSVTTTTTITDGVSVKEQEIKRKIQFTAQFAKRFGDIAIRAGLTENTFGLGADYFLLNDRAKLTADAWDFSKDEEGAHSPHVRVGIDYFIFKNIFVSAGGDNIFNKKWRGGYAGLGVRFEDEDLKYLFGTLPRISTQ
jgi:phospholipid/cholesterol/gamma-HCH transport system substrate-binding protein